MDLPLDRSGRPDVIGHALDLAIFQALQQQNRDITWYPQYAGNSVGFIEDVLGHKLWTKDEIDWDELAQWDLTDEELAEIRAGSDQRSIAEDFDRYPFVAVRASKGVGKTFLAADLISAFFATRKNALVVTTSKSWPHLETQLWPAIRAAAVGSRLPLPGHPKKTQWEADPDRYPKWMVIAVSPQERKTEEESREGGAGFHAVASRDPAEAAPTLVVIDEASGVSNGRWDAMMGALTNPLSKMLVSFNPTRMHGRAAEIWRSPTGEVWDELPGEERARRLEDSLEWRRHHINAFMAPRWVLGANWIRKMQEGCGRYPDVYRKSAVYQCDVLGRFAATEGRKVFPLELVEAASTRIPALPGRHMGVDIAHEGSDLCVATLVVDGRVAAIKRWAEPGQSGNLMRSAHIVRNLMLGDTWQDPESENRGWDVDPRNVHIDATGGWGLAVVERLGPGEMGFAVDPVVFSESAADEFEGYWRTFFRHWPKLRNRRQALHWIALRCLQDGLASIPAVPEFAGLLADVREIEFRGLLHSVEQFEVETSPEFKLRTGRSPDFLASWLCTFSRRPVGAPSIRRLTSGGKPVAVGSPLAARLARRAARRRLGA